VAAYVGLRQQHSSDISGCNSIDVQASSQQEKVPKLSDNEAEMHFIYEPAVETAVSPALLIDGHEQTSVPTQVLVLLSVAGYNKLRGISCAMWGLTLQH